MVPATNTPHQRYRRRMKKRKQLAEKVMRALKAYIRASRAYNYDCNMRCNAKPGDAKRNELFWKNQNAFTKLTNLWEQLNKS